MEEQYYNTNHYTAQLFVTTICSSTLGVAANQNTTTEFPFKTYINPK